MILDTFSLKGKVALVTGCNTGLGQAIALGLAEAGCDIVGVNRAKSTEICDQVSALGRRFFAIEAELGSNDIIPGVMEKALHAYGGLDILVNNAGIIRREDALDFREKDWDEVMDVNTKAVFFLSQAFARNSVRQGGRGKIINIASMLSFQGGIRVPSYTASKSAVLGLTRLMANEWAIKGININAIAPGYMVTSNTEQLRNSETRSKEIIARIPAGRWGEPADIKGAAVFLSSAASDYVNGHTLAVDGGWLAR